MAAVQRRESFSTNNDPEKTPTGALHYQHALSGLPDIAEDQAAEVLREVQEPPTALEKKTVLRKLDFVMLPLIFLIYGLSYQDKNVLSTAINFGAEKDLQLFYRQADGKLNTGRYSNATTMFYVGYIAGAPLMAWLAQRLPTGKLLSATVTLWGLTCMATVWCHTYHTLLVQRIFLGFCEAGVQPCFVLLIGSFYTKTSRHTFWGMGAGGSAPFAVAINYGMLHISNAHPWRNMFYFWGAFTMAFGIFLFFALPDSPVTAWMYDKRQKYVAVERLRMNQSGIANRHFKKAQALEAVLDVKVIIIGLLSFAVLTANALTSAFSQILFKQLLHASAYRSMVLTIPQGLMSAFICLGTFFVTSRYKNVIGITAIFCQSMVLLGAILLWALPPTNKNGLFAGIYLMSFFIGAVACIFGLASANVSGHTKKVVTAAWLVVAGKGADAGSPKFFLPTEAPGYTSGFTAIAICNIGAILLTAIYIYLCRRENKRRDALGEEAQVDRAFHDLTDRQNLSFRYVY